jgi:hypothetical protein
MTATSHGVAGSPSHQKRQASPKMTSFRRCANRCAVSVARPQQSPPPCFVRAVAPASYSAGPACGLKRTSSR